MSCFSLLHDNMVAAFEKKNFDWRSVPSQKCFQTECFGFIRAKAWQMYVWLTSSPPINGRKTSWTVSPVVDETTQTVL